MTPHQPITAVTGPAAEEERTSAHKINGGVQYRSPFGLDLALDVHLASEQTWVQAISRNEGSDVGVFRVPGYAIVNARIGYRLFDNALELAVIGNNIASTLFVNTHLVRRFHVGSSAALL